MPKVALLLSCSLATKADARTGALNKFSIRCAVFGAVLLWRRRLELAKVASSWLVNTSIDSLCIAYKHGDQSRRNQHMFNIHLDAAKKISARRRCLFLWFSGDLADRYMSNFFCSFVSIVVVAAFWLATITPSRRLPAERFWPKAPA